MNLQDIKFGEHLDPEIFSKIAEHIAKEITKAGKTEQNKTTQLRRFYDELLMWQEKVGTNDETYKELVPYIKMINAKTAYAKGRGHITQEFVDLFSSCLQQTKDARTLGQCKMFLEAFMGFYKLHKAPETKSSN